MRQLVGSCALLILLGGQWAAVPVVAAPVRFLAQQTDQVSVSPYEFLSTVMDCLARAHNSVIAINVQAADDFVGKMTATRNGSIELDISAQMLEPFTMSRDSKVRAASDAMFAAFGYMRTSFDMQHALYEKVNAATSVSELTGLGSSISEATDLYEQSSTLLIVAATAISSAVVPDRSEPQNHIALLMSAEEKASIVKTVKSRFEAKPAAGNTDTGPMQAAKVMLNALDQQRAPAK